MPSIIIPSGLAASLGIYGCGILLAVIILTLYCCEKMANAIGSNLFPQSVVAEMNRVGVVILSSVDFDRLIEMIARAFSSAYFENVMGPEKSLSPISEALTDNARLVSHSVLRYVILSYCFIRVRMC
jgi:hypothetical protein